MRLLRTARGRPLLEVQGRDTAAVLIGHGRAAPPAAGGWSEPPLAIAVGGRRCSRSRACSPRATGSAKGVRPAVDFATGRGPGGCGRRRSIRPSRSGSWPEGGWMPPAGSREVERARDDGRWDAAYDPQRATHPDDRRRALDENSTAPRSPRPSTAGTVLRSSTRCRTQRPETRARRIAKFVAIVNDGSNV